VARAPRWQSPLHDDREAIANLWTTPADVLARAERGEMVVILPTIRNLEAIGRFDRAEDLLATAAGTTDVPTVLPRVVADGEGTRILLPGDPGHPDPRTLA